VLLARGDRECFRVGCSSGGSRTGCFPAEGKAVDALGSLENAKRSLLVLRGDLIQRMEKSGSDLINKLLD
jgi:hypothetical protein